MVAEITLMEVYLIEILRKNNVQDDNILKKIRGRRAEEFAQYHADFDFSLLYHLDESGILEDVLQKGYRVKFLTFTGLINVLEIKFGKIEGVDFEIDNFKVKNLHMDEKDNDVLRTMLSRNWDMKVLPDGILIQSAYA